VIHDQIEEQYPMGNDQDKNEPEPMLGEGTAGVVGAAAGGAGGAILGTVMGMAVGGPVGALVGAGVGTVAGGALGYMADYDSHEPKFREHHESDPSRARHPFDEASPAYRYGWESHDNPELRDKTYDKIRPELHKGWTGSRDFVDYEDYVKHGWERRAASIEARSFSPAAKE